MAADVRIRHRLKSQSTAEKAEGKKRAARLRFLAVTAAFICIVFIFNILFLQFGEGMTALKPKSWDHFISINQKRARIVDDRAILLSESERRRRHQPTTPPILTGNVKHEHDIDEDITRETLHEVGNAAEGEETAALSEKWKKRSKLSDRLNPKPDLESDERPENDFVEKNYELVDVFVEKTGEVKHKKSVVVTKKKAEEDGKTEQNKSGVLANTVEDESNVDDESDVVVKTEHGKLETKSQPSTPKLLGKEGAEETPLPVLVNKQSSSEQPDLVTFIARLDDALAPFLVENRNAPCTKGWSDKANKKYLGGCYLDCKSFNSLEEAKAACELSELCGGIVESSPIKFELRSGNTFLKSSNKRESAYRRLSCYVMASATTLWNAFHDTVDAALDDPDLHLMDPAPAAREDDRIFISIASYRDENCPTTIKTAYEGAVHPENVFIGLIQQNCHKNCKNGVGWAKTRKIVDTDPDRDCIEVLCARAPEICERHRDQFRVLRLNETQTYGPFFARFLASKLWGGENYFMQIDAHMEFRPEWDVLMMETMKATPSYPKSVVSNYPPSVGSKWRTKYKYVPAALCGATFESAGSSRKTIRLSSSFRSKQVGGDFRTPRHSAFTAAGFFFAHGSMVELVPYDPFLPYLFMGEEIALSIRFWTSGFDIYAPVVDVTRHIYGRKNSIKFWETVHLLYGVGGLHNNICSELIQRVQNLVGFPEATEEALRKSKQGTKLDIFGLGSVRTREQFLQTMQLEPGKNHQTPPKWCIEGSMYPKLFSPEDTV